MEKRLFKVEVFLRKNTSGSRRELEVFTGKLVKSLIIDGNPKLKPFFEKASGVVPKLIHVTPLYVERIENGRRLVKCVHTLGGDNSFIESRYSFYIGFIETSVAGSPSFDEVYGAVLNLSGTHRFGSNNYDVELLSVEEIDVEKTVRETINDLKILDKIRIIFSSPTLLRDPFRKGKHKSLTPTPINIFSTPVYINLYLTGRLAQKLLIKSLIVLHRLLNEPYSARKTVNIIWIRYNEARKPIPALAGYINLFLNKDYYSQYVVKNIDVDLLLSETFTTLITLGTGTSRAAGFGHVTITTPASHSQTT